MRGRAGADASRVANAGQQPQRRVFLPRRQQTADVVEMQVRQHHHVDALVGQPDRSQRIEQHVAIPATPFRRKGACV